MARKPNYRFERSERERLQAERQARRDLRKAQGRGESQATTRETGEAQPRNDLPERSDG